MWPRRVLGSSAAAAAACAAWSTTGSLCHSKALPDEGRVPPPAGLRQVLTSVAQNLRVDHWRVSGLASDQPWSVEKRTLHGGRQEGVDIIEVDNGRLKFTVVPTRGMSIGSLEAADAGGGGRQSFGWASPVREYPHPAHVDLQDFGGLGWLTGFNEWCVRCGVAFAGHPAEEAGGHLLTLHGRIGNIPASEVEVVVDAEAPHRIRVRRLCP